MAENVRETKPPELPPKPTEQPSRSEAKDHGQPNESQQSAQQDARNAAQSEHAKATAALEPDGLRPTPEVQARLDEHSAGKMRPDGLRSTSEAQERLDVHTAAKAERNAPGPQDSGAVERPQDTTVGDRSAVAPVGEQAGEHAAARQAAAAERAKAVGDVATSGEAPRPQPIQDASELALDNGQPQAPARTTQPPEGSRNDESVTASPPDESAATRRPDDQNTPRQPTVDQDNTTQGQSALDENAQRQMGADEDAQHQPAVEEKPQRHPAADQNGAQQASGEYQSTAEEHAGPPAETTDETMPPEETRQPTRLDSRGREIPDEVQRLPSGRLPANWYYAGRVYDGEHWTPDLAARYPDGVRFTNDGFPDFSPYATHTVTFDPQYQGNTTTDFSNANRLAVLPRTPDDYTWHHHQDTRTMQLVPTEIHDAVRHAGGRAILR